MARKAKGSAGPAVGQPEEHPEDRKMREEGVAYGAKHAPEFCAWVAQEMTRLIGTYSDAEAQDLFDVLRARFWLRDWKPKGYDEGTPLKAAP